MVAYATDTAVLALAAKYESPQLLARPADEALLQRYRNLAQSVGALAAARATRYGLTPVAVAALTKENDDYAALIVAPQDERATRSVLTASLPGQARAVTALFDSLEDLLPQFGCTPAGDAFIEAFLAASAVISSGRGPSAPEPAQAPAAPAAKP